MAKAMVRTVRPNASDTPTKPIPSCGKAAASTALPQPAKVSQKVPKNSAPTRRVMSMWFTPSILKLDRFGGYSFRLPEVFDNSAIPLWPIRTGRSRTMQHHWR